MACDICLKTGTDLVDLKEEFSTKEIKCVCDDCGSEINKMLWDMRKCARKFEVTLTQRFMKNKREKATK